MTITKARRTLQGLTSGSVGDRWRAWAAEDAADAPDCGLHGAVQLADTDLAAVEQHLDRFEGALLLPVREADHGVQDLLPFGRILGHDDGHYLSRTTGDRLAVVLLAVTLAHQVVLLFDRRDPAPVEGVALCDLLAQRADLPYSLVRTAWSASIFNHAATSWMRRPQSRSRGPRAPWPATSRAASAGRLKGTRLVSGGSHR